MDTRIRVLAVLKNRNRYNAISIEDIADLLDTSIFRIQEAIQPFVNKGYVLQANGCYFMDKMPDTSDK